MDSIEIKTEVIKEIAVDQQKTITNEVNDNVELNLNCNNEINIFDDQQKTITNEVNDNVELKLNCNNEINIFETENALNKYSNVTIIGSIVTSDHEAETVIEQGQSIKKKKLSNELGRLEIHEAEENHDSEYDTYIDDKDNIFKKYRLRERQKTNYRIPTISDLPEIYVPKTVRKSKTIQCTHCAVKFESCSELRKHIRHKHKVIYTCMLCSQTFDTNIELINHKKIHEQENHTYLCHDCKEAFSDHRDYLLHELTHSKIDKFYTCPECGYIYYKKYSYEIHICTHFSKPLKCPICSKEVNGERYLKQHIHQHSKTLKCVECELILKDKTSYDAHMAIHTGVKLHQCLYCGKAFRLRGQKEVHTRIHTQEKRFSCTICDKKFLMQTDFQRHVIKHDTDKKLKCKVCNKKFKLKMDLASHMRVHSKEYKCPECSKTLSSSSGLRAHILYIHCTERPEICSICNMKFLDKTSLKRHFRSKRHKNNEFKSTMGKAAK